jgi:hypothetical protein
MESREKTGKRKGNSLSISHHLANQKQRVDPEKTTAIQSRRQMKE